MTGSSVERPDERRRVIAIDGLSGAGKSTVARVLARELGWGYLDTGASYRAVALAAVRAGAVTPGSSVATSGLGDRAMSWLASLDLPTDPDVRTVRFAGADVTAEIRSADVTATVSAVAADPGVRSAAVAWQRAAVSTSAGCVVEGRDIGTVVFPSAPLKVWLTASVERRAGRRARERTHEGGGVAAIVRRDTLDAGRTADPARPAPDAVVVDTDLLDVSGVVAVVRNLAAERGLVG